MEGGGVPRVVFYQALNFFALLGLIYFFTRNKVTGFFNKRHETLKAAIFESRKLKEEAEKRHQEYTLKFQSLEKETQSTMERVCQEGEEVKKRIIEEAKKAAADIENETKKTIQLELSRARKQLFEEAINKSLGGAQELLHKNIGPDDQQKLQKEFLTRIETAQ